MRHSAYVYRHLKCNFLNELLPTVIYLVSHEYVFFPLFLRCLTLRLAVYL